MKSEVSTKIFRNFSKYLDLLLKFHYTYSDCQAIKKSIFFIGCQAVILYLMQKKCTLVLSSVVCSFLSEIKILLRGAEEKELWVSRILRRYPKPLGANS